MRFGIDLIQGEAVKQHDLKKWHKLEIKEKLIYLNIDEMYNSEIINLHEITLLRLISMLLWERRAMCAYFRAALNFP